MSFYDVYLQDLSLISQCSRHFLAWNMLVVVQQKDCIFTNWSAVVALTLQGHTQLDRAGRSRHDRPP